MLQFTESSSDHLNLAASVAFAKERAASLQSARETWLIGIGQKGALDSNKYQGTRTAALGVKIDGKYCIAIDDSSDPTQNILLARAQEGYDAYNSTGKWLVPKSDPLINRMLDRAYNAKRVFPALEQTLKLSTASAPTSEYGAHPSTRAILGEDLTQHVAIYLRERNRSYGHVWTPSPTELSQLGVDNDHVKVLRVVVGGKGDSISYLVADGKGYSGRARGVRNISTGNRGGL
jgi:hypothetical protein